MPTCGYICPSCGGSEHMEDGTPCTWCKPVLAKSSNHKKEKQEAISDEEWLNSVHFGDCCSDRVEPEQKKKEQGNT